MMTSFALSVVVEHVSTAKSTIKVPTFWEVRYFFQLGLDSVRLSKYMKMCRAVLNENLRYVKYFASNTSAGKMTFDIHVG